LHAAPGLIRQSHWSRKENLHQKGNRIVAGVEGAKGIDFHGLSGHDANSIEV